MPASSQPAAATAVGLDAAILHAASLLADVPFLLCGAAVLLTVYRAPLLIAQLRSSTTVPQRRAAALIQTLLLPLLLLCTRRLCGKVSWLHEAPARNRVWGFD